MAAGEATGPRSGPNGEEILRAPGEKGQAPGAERVLTSVVEPASGPVGGRKGGWLAAITPLPQTSGDGGAGQAALAPLLAPNWSRAILTTLVSTQSDADGPIDIEGAVDHLAAGRPLARLPRQPWPTNRFGAHLLLDMGEGMVGFRGDQQQIAAAVTTLVGKDAVTVLRFAGCPTRGAGVRSRATWSAFEPPPPGRRVLVVSDLGMTATGAGDRATTAEWIAFADGMRRARCPLAALTPYPAARAPAPLRRAMGIVPWDRSTTVAAVRKALGPWR